MGRLRRGGPEGLSRRTAPMSPTLYVDRPNHTHNRNRLLSRSCHLRIHAIRFRGFVHPVGRGAFDQPREHRDNVDEHDLALTCCLATSASRQAAHSRAEPRAMSKSRHRSGAVNLPFPSAIFSAMDVDARSSWSRTAMPVGTAAKSESAQPTKRMDS